MTQPLSCKATQVGKERVSGSVAEPEERETTEGGPVSEPTVLPLTSVNLLDEIQGRASGPGRLGVAVGVSRDDGGSGRGGVRGPDAPTRLKDQGVTEGSRTNLGTETGLDLGLLSSTPTTVFVISVKGLRPWCGTPDPRL